MTDEEYFLYRTSCAITLLHVLTELIKESGDGYVGFKKMKLTGACQILFSGLILEDGIGIKKLSKQLTIICINIIPFFSEFLNRSL